MASKSQATAYRNKAAQRVLTVLNEFSGRVEPVSAAELGATLQMSKNMIHRALTLLEEEGLVIRARKSNCYTLGPRVLSFFKVGYDDSEDINALCRPYMHQLVELTGESVFLGIIVGQNRVVIDKIESRGPRVAHSQRGLAVPLHISKASRVLLAYQEDAQINSYLAEAPPLSDYADLFTEAGKETIADVWQDISTIRKDGHISWRNPHQYGAAYIAFPVLGSDERAHAVISMGAPIERMPEDRLKELLPQMKEIIRRVNDRSRLLPALPPFIPEGKRA